jgi:CheY-like chemotaxis protein
MNSARREKRSLRVVAAPASDRLAVLLVEGNRDDALAARRWLAEQAGLETRLVADSAAATRELAQRPWDLLAIDLALPGALEFQRRMRSRNRWTATLAVTANQDAGFIQSVVEARVDGLLFKPVAKPRFVAQVLDIAAQARERRRRQQKRVLAIGAHPDDVELGCGGALAKHRGQGDVMTILTLSRGANGGDTNVRTREAHSAANLLGATLEASKRSS